MLPLRPDFAVQNQEIVLLDVQFEAYSPRRPLFRRRRLALRRLSSHEPASPTQASASSTPGLLRLRRDFDWLPFSCIIIFFYRSFCTGCCAVLQFQKIFSVVFIEMRAFVRSCIFGLRLSNLIFLRPPCFNAASRPKNPLFEWSMWRCRLLR